MSERSQLRSCRLILDVLSAYCESTDAKRIEINKMISVARHPGATGRERARSILEIVKILDLGPLSTATICTELLDAAE